MVYKKKIVKTSCGQKTLRFHVKIQDFKNDDFSREKLKMHDVEDVNLFLNFNAKKNVFGFLFEFFPDF